MGHYAGEMGYSSRRDFIWQKWGFVSLTPVLVCPVCFATVPEYPVQMDTTSDKRSLPWMEHVMWHKQIQNDGSTYGWVWPVFIAKDTQEAWDLGSLLDDYAYWGKLPGDPS